MFQIVRKASSILAGGCNMSNTGLKKAFLMMWMNNVVIIIFWPLLRIQGSSILVALPQTNSFKNLPKNIKTIF